MRNVIVIINTLTGGGAERVATNLATCLSKTENVTLVVEHLDGNTYGSTVKTIDLKMSANKGKLKFLWHIRLAMKLKRVKKELNVTNSISFLSEPGLANVLSRGNEQVIVSERNYLSAKKSKILHWKEAWLMRHSDMVVSLSEMVRQDIMENYGVPKQKTVTIYNPCYAEAIHKKIAECEFPEEEKEFLERNKGRIVLTAGRLVDQKGHWHLIRAFRKVVNEIPDAKLIILGQGGNEDYLREIISGLRLEENVKMWGYKANPYGYMARADLFAFPSLFEGLGNIIVECMAIGLPVLSTDCKYGPKELLDPGADYTKAVTDITEAQYGILVPPLDGKKYTAQDALTKEENLLADAIKMMVLDPEKRRKYSEAISNRGKDFTPDNITNQWIGLLK